MKQVRIAGGAGYAGDRIEPALDSIRRGNVDYIIFECLAERTIALAQKERRHCPEKGYNPLLEYRMEKVIPLLREHPVKIITNMGAANPMAAGRKIAEIAQKNGLRFKIAVIEGDDVLKDVMDHYELPIMETGESLGTLQGKIVSANAYIGAREITQALAQGADIVVTGRVADPSLVTGPLMHEFGKSYSDPDFLGKTIVAGHLLECGGQVTGGYYADPGKKEVPELWNLGFPILTFDEAGDCVLEKLPDTGGVLNSSTVKEQLLYEIQDPENYFTPDVIADFSRLRVTELEDGRVKVEGAGGKQRTGMLKVSVGYEDGYIGEGEISYGGRNARARAELAGEVIRHRLEGLDVPIRGPRIDLIGVNSLYGGALACGTDPVEVRLRVAAHVATYTAADQIGKEVEALYTNGPAGGGGARSAVREILSIASVLIPEETIKPAIHWVGGEDQ